MERAVHKIGDTELYIESANSDFKVWILTEIVEIFDLSRARQSYVRINHHIKCVLICTTSVALWGVRPYDSDIDYGRDQ